MIHTNEDVNIQECTTVSLNTPSLKIHVLSFIGYPPRIGILYRQSIDKYITNLQNDEK